ncbi:unnamed protein product [Larinioides sclopetarius]|uniref:C2H2-type domain-containing protein n=1 Tax=Larinioides sclopetarius TaxID=280406 RepID=A0AAV1Z566_9ARAC
MQKSTEDIQYKKMDFCLQEKRIFLPFTTCIRDGVILLNLTTGTGSTLNLMKKQLGIEPPAIKEEIVLKTTTPKSSPIPLKAVVNDVKDESILDGEKLAQKILNEFRLKNSEAQTKKPISTAKQKNIHERVLKIGSNVKLKGEQNISSSELKKLSLKEKYREINKKRNLKVLRRRSQLNTNNSAKSKIQLKYKLNLSKGNKSFDPNGMTSDLSSSNYFISCRFCRQSFKVLEDIQNHNCNDCKSTFKQRMYKCDLCLSEFKYKNYLDRHMKGHNRNNCKFCTEQFTKRKALCKHLKSVHNITEPEKLYKCSFCEKIYAKRPQLLIHMKDHAEGKYLCLKCGFMSSNSEEHTEHEKEHIKITKFECTLCGKKFVRRQQHDQHMVGHERHSCLKCNVTFSTKKMLLKHQQSVHGMSVLKKHQCLTCHKSFLRPVHLQNHERIHTGEKPVKCSKCEKSFTTERSLAKHLKSARHLQIVNNGKEVELEKPFLCSICGNRFHQQQSLLRHIEQIHTEGEAIKCPHCEYSTKCKANLKRHTEGHFNIKRYVCEICGASFRALATLKEHHLFVHSENRNFVCEICKKSFKNKSGLQRHLRIHSEVRPYKCHCDRDYKRLSHLKRHMVSAHRMTVRRSSDAKKLEVFKIEPNHIDEKSKSISSESTEEERDSTSSSDVNLLNLAKNFLSDHIFEADLNKTITDGSLAVRTSNNNGDDIYVPHDNLQNLIEKNDANISPDIIQKSPLMSIQQSIIPSDSQDSLSLDDPALNLSPNYFTFSLSASPLGVSNLDNVSENSPPSTLCTPDTATRPRSLPNLASQISNTDSLFSFSFRNNEFPSSFLLGSDLPASLDHNSSSKQLFGESGDILSMASFTSSNESDVMDCDSENFFSISHNCDIWDVSSDSKIVTEIALDSCGKVPSSVSNFSSNSDSLLACNLVFPNDPLLDCTIDSSSFNTEDFVLT